MIFDFRFSILDFGVAGLALANGISRGRFKVERRGACMGKEELQLIRKTATWNFPQATQARLDDLLNRKPDLSPGEIRELDALIAPNDEMSEFKASALKLLHQRGEPVG